jgi:hypothetical protein
VELGFGALGVVELSVVVVVVVVLLAGADSELEPVVAAPPDMQLMSTSLPFHWRTSTGVVWLLVVVLLVVVVEDVPLCVGVAGVCVSVWAKTSPQASGTAENNTANFLMETSSLIRATQAP